MNGRGGLKIRMFRNLSRAQCIHGHWHQTRHSRRDNDAFTPAHCTRSKTIQKLSTEINTFSKISKKNNCKKKFEILEWTKKRKKLPKKKRDYRRNSKRQRKRTKRSSRKSIQDRIFYILDKINFLTYIRIKKSFNSY